MSFFLFFAVTTFSQDQKISDSLKTIFRKNQYDRKLKLRILDDIVYYETNPDEVIIYSKELIESAKELDSFRKKFNGYYYLGIAYRKKGDLAKAIETLLKGSKIADQQKYIDKKADVKVALAGVYSEMGDFNQAIKNYKESIKFYKQENDSVNIASVQYNLGDEFYSHQYLDSALVYYKKSSKLFDELGYAQYQAYILGSEGLVYAQLDDEVLARNSLNEAINILKEYEDYDPIAEFLIGMSDVYYNRNEKRKALSYALQSLEIANQYGFKSSASEANLRLSKIYTDLGNVKKAFESYKSHISFRDSINNVTITRDIEQERSKSELEKKEQEKQLELAKKQSQLDLAEQQKKTQKIVNIGIAIVLILIAILAYILFRRNKFITETNKIIEAEKQRSEGLLMNILPEETAQELKEKGSVEAKKYDAVSVLFTDFKGFTAYSEKMSPEDLVKSIDYYFSKIDKIVEKYEVEKIKTIGDAYMCACGLPFPEKEHAYKITMAALEIVEFINQTKFINQKNLAKFDIRVGIHTGPVVAGVVGTKKFAYDIWGDTVNTASRMESSGEIGRVNISEDTYQILKNYEDFVFEKRGAIEAKGKGAINMYFVNKKAFF